jgi:DNA (cytosine-5)-methyltransferase 1
MPRRRDSFQGYPFYEFFAGGGMARLGLGPAWRCTFANDCCDKKAAAYRSYFGAGPYVVADVASLKPTDLPGTPVLVWASFPCQDLSLAGNGAGLAGERSGTFRPFWKLVRGLVREGRGPRIVVLENVTGTLTSHGGRDFTAIAGTLMREGYRVGALVIDAVQFVPQSRPRLFIIAVGNDVAPPARIVASEGSGAWHTESLWRAYEQLPAGVKREWVWWNLPSPHQQTPSLTRLIEDPPTGTAWHTVRQTNHILGLMAPLHREKVREAKLLGSRAIGMVYRRTRLRTQRAEVRFDDVSGCLRTPAGGSSRQTMLIVEGRRIRSRLLSPREAARLMGVPDDYPLPKKYNQAYHLFGDGVVVPVVRWLSDHLLINLAKARRRR